MSPSACIPCALVRRSSGMWRSRQAIAEIARASCGLDRKPGSRSSQKHTGKLSRLGCRSCCAHARRLSSNTINGSLIDSIPSIPESLLQGKSWICELLLFANRDIFFPRTHFDFIAPQINVTLRGRHRTAVPSRPWLDPKVAV